MSADAHTIPTPQATYAQRVAFVSEIAGRLHSYGTTAQRLETAVVALARQLDLDCEPWSNPTGIILSFSDPAQAIGSSDITRVIRRRPVKTTCTSSALPTISPKKCPTGG